MITTLTHPDYTAMISELKAVRDSVLGAWAVKRESYTYLPHPSDIDRTSGAALLRYDSYLRYAEFDEIPQQTLKSWLGRMQFSAADIELPQRLDYLIQNADNDGMSLRGMIEQAASNVMQVGWHLLIADYQNAPAPGEQLSAEQARLRNVRATFKSYTRESVLDWSFARINGVLQLSYLKLVETRSELDYRSGERKPIVEYLVYALDDSGALYWQKFTDKIPQSQAPINPVTINKQPLRWIPCEIISDMEYPAGNLPQSLGLLAPICRATLDRYVVSAAYKESLIKILSTVYTSGWTPMTWESYQEINQINYIPIGACALANLPEGVTMGVLETSRSFDSFIEFFADNRARIIALGGVWPDEGGKSSKSATQSENESSEVTSRLVTLANNLEQGFLRLIAYCGMFENLWPQDDIERNLESITVSLTKDFARTKLTPAEQKEIRDNLLAGVYSRTEAIRLLVRGGVTVSDVETILADGEDGDGLTIGG